MQDKHYHLAGALSVGLPVSGDTGRYSFEGKPQ
jgi:hypothetical protein